MNRALDRMSNRELRAYLEAHPTAKPGHPEWSTLLAADAEVRRRIKAGEWYRTATESIVDREVMA